MDECGSGGLVVVDDGKPAVAGESSAERPVSEKARDALRWATSLQDDSIIENLALELPAAVVEEQIALHERHLLEAAVEEPIAKPILVYPHLLRSRMHVAAEFNNHLRLSHSWSHESRMPRGATTKFWSRLSWSTAT